MNSREGNIISTGKSSSIYFYQCYMLFLRSVIAHEFMLLAFQQHGELLENS